MDEAANPQALLEQMAGQDPRMRLLAQAMAGGLGRQADEGRQQALDRRLQRMQALNRQLQERNDLLADALGAFPACWGDDASCRLCRGRGRPGFSIPAQQAFADAVAPVLERLGWTRTYNWTQDNKRGQP